MGSLIADKQLKTVADTSTTRWPRGRRVLAGGKARPDIGPYFYEPTILTGVHDGMAAFADETFGPVVSLYRVADRGRGDRAGQRQCLRV